MDKKKKIIIISVVSLVIIALIVGLIIFFVMRNNNGEEGTAIASNSSKIAKLYDDLNKEQSFSFTTTLDDNNKEIYAKNGNTAYTDTIYDGEESKFIIRDGNSYLLRDSDKVYYTYQNNEVNLNKILEQLNEIKDTELVEGKEEIEGKNYNYEEYTGITNFAIKLTDENNSENVKTRFYFDGNDLVYIKTIVENNQELLRVEISNDVDSNLFEIPNDYVSR